jgi:serine/threonine protein kinase
VQRECGTDDILSSEELLGIKDIDVFASDMWSTGIIFAYMISHDLPFDSYDL